jgi:hypothetical protein
LLAYSKNKQERHSHSSTTTNDKKHTTVVSAVQQTLEQCLSRTQRWQIDHPSAVKIHNAIGRMIAIDIQPIQLVENTGFVELVQLLEPRYQIPSRKYITERVLPDLFEQVKIKILKQMEDIQGVSFTVDHWTSNHTTQSYMSLTAHWLTRTFDLKSAVLHCEPFDGSHTAAHIGSAFLEMVEKWHIPIHCCHTVLHDNAPNIVKAFRDAPVKHATCFAHTIQLVIKDAILSQRYVADILTISRNIVGHFKHSTSASSRLHELQLELNIKIVQLVQDVPTRWNSVFYMLQRLLEQRRAVTLYCAETGAVTNLDPNQWVIAESLISLLTPFEEITRDISNARASISMVIPAVKDISTILGNVDNSSGVKTTKAELLQSLNRRLGSLESSTLFSIATVLDPRFKLRCFTTEGSKANAKASLFVACEQLSKPLQLQSTNSYKEPEAKKQRISDHSPWASLDEILSITPHDNQVTASIIETELSTYLAEGLLPRKEDPFLWWKLNQHRLPTMASMALVYLASPPTSVPSERVFSTAGDIITDHRSRLLPENAEKLILLKFNLHLLDS